jgi:uncharacterized protein YprB with RNaseH-like and TPR domain
MQTAIPLHRQTPPFPGLAMAEICRAWLNSNPLFLDTETTGLDEHAEIVELAVVDGQGEALNNTLVR